VIYHGPILWTFRCVNLVVAFLIVTSVNFSGVLISSENSFDITLASGPIYRPSNLSTGTEITFSLVVSQKTSALYGS
jgi:hypothetical protein